MSANEMKRIRVREIGSDFAVTPRVSGCGYDPGPGTVWLSTGRDAIDLAVRALGLTAGDEVFLPSYLCEDVIVPFREHNVAVRFYRVNERLVIDRSDLFNRWSARTRAVLVIHYFGFTNFEDVVRIRDTRPDLPVIEDCSHSFLSDSEAMRDGCMRVASVRKMLPLPDGAFLRWERDGDQHLRRMMVRSPLNQARLVVNVLAGKLKQLWLSGWPIPKRLFRWLFWSGEVFMAKQPKPAPMSLYARRELRSQDIGAIVSRRRENFCFLLEQMRGVEGIRPLYESLGFGICPLGFPIVADDRDGLRDHLIRERIYPPIHWELPVEVDGREFADAAKLAQSTMTLPIDQRYTLDDMARVSDAVHAFLRIAN